MLSIWGNFFRAARSPKPEATRPETVVLLHGLGLSSWAMRRIASALNAAGYAVLNLAYPSRTLSLERLADEWLPRRLEAQGVIPVQPLHFVTHSMGGLILRRFVQTSGARFQIKRAVMLAPPNQGSEVVDRLHRQWAFRWFTGVNGKRLGTGRDAFPRTLGPWPAHIELGIVAGSRSINPVFSAWVPRPNDGPVAVASTHLEGMRAHCVRPHSHTCIQWYRDVIQVVVTFLQTGAFDHERPR